MSGLPIALIAIPVVVGAIVGIIALYGRAKQTSGKKSTEARFFELVAEQEKQDAARLKEVVGMPRLNPAHRIALMRQLSRTARRKAHLSETGCRRGD